MLRNLIMRIRGYYPIEYYKRRGMIVGENFSCQPKCFFDPSHCFLISIGNNVTISKNVSIYAHDDSTKFFLDYAKIQTVKIGNCCFIGANSIILPGVTLGDNCIVGAGSVVTKSFPSNSVIAENPAKFLENSDKYIKKNKLLMEESRCFSEEYIYNKRLSKSKIAELKSETSKGRCYSK